MLRLTSLLPTLPAIFASSTLLTFGTIAYIQARAALDGAGRPRPGEPDSSRPDSARPDLWRLRPGDVATTSSIERPAPKGGGAAQIPEERRPVRVVYPGLVGPR